MIAAMIPADIPPKGPPTLKTIAFMTGLGISTVSRALKDGPEIGADTKARVKLIAREIGYRPNRAGVRLKTGKTNVITVVLNAGEDGSGFFSNFVYGISDALSGTSYHLVVTPYSLSDPMAPVRYIVAEGRHGHPGRIRDRLCRFDRSFDRRAPAFRNPPGRKAAQSRRLHGTDVRLDG